MYAVSKAYDEAIKGRTRQIVWYGVITLKDGTEIPFGNNNIVENTGTLTRSCSSQSSIDIGGVYASELQMSLRIDIDRYTLSEAEINLSSRLNFQSSVQTWGDASNYIWAELQTSNNWGEETRWLYADVPMGIFTVSEALRAVNSVKITAYDNMLKFDKNLPTMDTKARTPFEWLRWICEACDVKLGITNNDIKAMTNGGRNLTFADVNDEVSTYRDLLSELAVVLASVATINRYGELVLLQYKMTPVETIDASFRYTSDFSDYQSYYTGLYASYRAKAMQEYYRNVMSLEDNGLVYDIGYNVFLQIASDSNRMAAIQAIIDSQKPNKYIPFNVSMPFNPAYDLMDIILFKGNQATDEDIAPITSITYKINDKMTIQCTGENPKLLTAQSKESKAIAGLNDGTSLSGVSYVSSDFWIMTSSYPADTAEITQNEVTTQVTITATVDNTRTQIVWTGSYTLDSDCVVSVDIQVNDTSIYSVSDSQNKGVHTLNTSTGYEFNTKGEHTVKVFINAEGNTIHFEKDKCRLTVIGTGWSNTSFDSGDGFTEDGNLWKDLTGDLNYDYGDDVDWDSLADEYLNLGWSDIIYTDKDDNVYTDPDGDGIYTDSLTGKEYPGGGDKWIVEGALADIADSVWDVAFADSELLHYNIPSNVLSKIYGGKVTTEIHQIETDSSRPHQYNPAVYYIQLRSNSAVLFLNEPFVHTNREGGNIQVYDEAVTIRSGSIKRVYYSDCTTQFTTNYPPSPYINYPEQYIAWQCLYGSFEKALTKPKDNALTGDDIRNGKSGLESRRYNGRTYYKV